MREEQREIHIWLTALQTNPKTCVCLYTHNLQTELQSPPQPNPSSVADAVVLLALGYNYQIHHISRSSLPPSPILQLFLSF